MTFDAWEVGVSPAEDYLMHWGIRGMKHGTRRYQNEDGTWTEAGLEARRKREGFGEGRKERKAIKRLARAERHMARRQARAQARAAYAEKKRQKSIKGLTDEELQKKINRLKMEQEYRSLNKSPLIETGAKLVKAYFEMKDKQRKYEMDKANLIVRDRESKAKLANAKAENLKAKNDLIDNVFSGKGKKKAKAELIKAKADNQVRGAIRKAVSGIITKEGRRFVNEMGENSRTMKIGRGIKNGINKARTKSAERVVNMIKDTQYKQAGIKRPQGATNYTTAGAHPAVHPTSGKKIKGKKGWKKR